MFGESCDARGMAKRITKARTRPSALVRAEHNGAPVHLSTPQKRVFDEALRLGEDLADDVESKVAAYGRWLLQAVFGNDAASALDEKTKNPVWLELVRRSGGPSLRVSRRMLYVAPLLPRGRRERDRSVRLLEALVLVLPLDRAARTP